MAGTVKREDSTCTGESMLRGGKSGPAIMPGKADISRLIRKTRDARMPPPERLVEVSVKPIEAAEIAVLTRGSMRAGRSRG